MPIYEFVCESCGHEFEQIVSFSAQHSPACPSCAAETVNRRMSKPAIHFKGSGWYITDSKSDTKKSNGSNGAEKAKSTSDSSESAQSESESSSAEKTPAKSETTKSEPAKSDTAKSDA